MMAPLPAQTGADGLGVDALPTTGSTGSGSAQDDPSEVWLRAYMIMKDGAQMEEAGDHLGALAKYQEAKRFFQFITRSHPNWKQGMMSFRLTELMAKIDDVKAKAAQGNGGVAPNLGPLPSHQAPGGNGSRPIVENHGTVVMTPPAEYGVPAPVAPQTVTEFGNQEMARLRSAYDLKVGENVRLQNEAQQSSLMIQGLQNQLTQARTADQALRNQLAAITTELEAARKGDGTKVQKLEADLKLALEDLKKSNAFGAKVMADLETAQRQLEGQKGVQAAAMETAGVLQRKLNEAEAGLTKARADLAAAQEQIKNAQDKPEMSKDAEAAKANADQALAQAQADVERLKKDLETANAQNAKLAETTKRLEEALTANGEVTAQNTELMAELKKAQATNTQLNERVAALEFERDQLKTENAAVTQRLANAIAERDQARKDLDEMAILLDASENIEGEIKDMVKANQRWQRELSDAKEQIVTLTQKGGASENEITRLKKQVEAVRTDRDRMKVQNDQYHTTVEELNAKLAAMIQAAESKDSVLGQTRAKVEAMTEEQRKAQENINSMLASSKEENEMLKGLIRGQLLKQVSRKNARDLVFQELRKVDSVSLNLITSLNELTGPRLEMSEQQLSMFKDEADLKLIEEVRQDDKKADEALELAKEHAVNAKPLVPRAPNLAADSAIGPKGAAQANLDLERLQKAANYDFGLGNLEKAAEAYRELVAINRKDVFSLTNLAIVYVRQGKVREAQIQVEQALAHKPGYAPAQYCLGVIFYKKRELDRALDAFGSCVQADVNNADAHNFIGLIASEKGWGTRAEQEFVKATTLNPKHAKAHFNLAVLYATRGQPAMDRARDHYQKAIRTGAERDAAIENIIGS